MPSRCTWLHLSDIHIKSGDPYDRDVVLRALLRSLPTLKPRDEVIDFIFVTGDITFSGKVEEYQVATKFLDALLAETGVEKSKLFIIPGNHDVDRTASIGLVRTLSSENESVAYFAGDEPKVHIALKQKNFKNWYDSYFSGERTFSESSTCSPIYSVTIRGYRVDILLINSAAFSADDGDHGKLWIGRRCLDTALSHGPSGTADLSIAMLHHPLEWLSESEQRNISRLLRSRFDCVLHGHLHLTNADAISGVNGSTVQLTAGAAYQTRNWPNRAMFVSSEPNKLRILPIRYEDDPEAWTRDPSVFPESENSVGTVELPPSRLTTSSEPDVPGADLLGEDTDTRRPTPPDDVNSQPPPNRPTTRAAKEEFERDLFVSASGTPLYVPFRISSRSQTEAASSERTEQFISVLDIVQSTRSYIVEARSEYGGTTLCRRIVYEFSKDKSRHCSYFDTQSLPNYRAKLRHVMPDSLKAKEFNVALLDNFVPQLHEKLLSEFRSLDLFGTIIIVVKPNLIPSESIVAPAGFECDRLYLWGIDRSEIRELTRVMFDTADETFVSAIVDKVYADLLALCIPLTPSNVIMYLRVLYKEDEFYPFNRVDIVARYLSEALSRSSELYLDSFNSRAKLDLAAEFSYNLFCRQATFFEEADWYLFCDSYKADKLIDFSANSLLSDLTTNRVVVRVGSRLYFRYGFFFSFLVGRHISHRGALLASFLDRQDRDSLIGIVEVIAGLSGDNAVLMERILSDLYGNLSEFSIKYIDQSFDPLSSSKWPDNIDEDEKLWAPVEKQIAEGPIAPRELDLFKTSLSSEARTEDQRVRYAELRSLEVSLFRTAAILSSALRAGGGISGDLKKRIVASLFKTYVIMLQVGVILAPKLAESNSISWGGLLFLGFSANERDPLKKDTWGISHVIAALPPSIMNKAGEEIGLQNLGPVFIALLASVSGTKFEEFLTFSCLISAKPSGWSELAALFVEKVDKNSFYLIAVLQRLIYEYKLGVNQTHDRDAIARLIAQVRTKRSLGKNAPGAKAITRTLRLLLETNQVAPD